MRVSGTETTVVAATREACFAVLCDLAAYPQWYPGVSEAQVVADAAEPTARLVFDAGLSVLPAFECVMALRAEAPSVVVPRVESGSLNVAGDGWRLDRAGEGATTVTLALDVEMKVPGGRMAERLIGSRGRRYLIEEPVRALVERVGAG